ncbi:MAG: response regulator, partial [Planctomycetaceae bacterium]|nr:response regulator [Planctomycetaceae bacterium]
MPGTLRVLLIDDGAEDEPMIRRQLSRDGHAAFIQRVNNRADFLKALNEGEWDIVIADYHLPQFSAMEALALLRKVEADLPFILISGTIGEEVAVEAIKAGADDYLLKQNPVRLASAVLRAIRDSQTRTRQREAEQALRESRGRLDLIYNSVSELLIFLTRSPDGEWIFTSANRAFMEAPFAVALGGGGQSPELAGRPTEDIKRQIFHLNQQAAEWLSERREEAYREQKPVQSERSFETPVGQFIIQLNHIPIIDSEGQCRHMLIAGRDVTDLRRAERQEREARDQMLQAQKLEALGTLSGGIAHDFNN